MKMEKLSRKKPNHHVMYSWLNVENPDLLNCYNGYGVTVHLTMITISV